MAQLKSEELEAPEHLPSSAGGDREVLEALRDNARVCVRVVKEFEEGVAAPLNQLYDLNNSLSTATARVQHGVAGPVRQLQELDSSLRTATTRFEEEVAASLRRVTEALQELEQRLAQLNEHTATQSLEGAAVYDKLVAKNIRLRQELDDTRKALHAKTQVDSSSELPNLEQGQLQVGVPNYIQSAECNDSTCNLAAAINVPVAQHEELVDGVNEKLISPPSGEVLNAAVFLTHPTIHQVITRKTPARGIAVLASEIFVGGESAEIDEYDIKTFSITRIIPIPYSVTANVLVACSHNNCLYASTDEYKSIIHRFDLSYNSSSHWRLSGQCCGLSVTRNFNLIATLYDNRMQEYATQGSLIREIVLKNCSQQLDARLTLHHSVQLSSGEFVVCQTGFGSEHKVCIVDSTGQVLKSYGGPKGSGDGHLNNPYQLSVDKSDNVIVADYSNNRIVLLSQTLTLLGYIPMPGDKLVDPWAVHLDAMTGYLFIVELDTGHVLVLKASA